jgi:hypothetical protein
MKTTFKTAKPGDRVWDIRKGWGTIFCNHIDDEYPIEVNFDSESNDTFTLEGKAFRLDLNPTLFWDELKFVVPEQPPRTKLINGVEVPDTSFQPKADEDYYFPSPDIPSMCYDTRYRPSNSTDRYRAKNGMCYPYTEKGRQAAILHAKAMLGIKE